MAQRRRLVVPLPLVRPRPYSRRYQTFPRPRSRERMVGDLSSLPAVFVHPCLNFFAASTTVVSSSTVPPKKFSAVKINKRFMEQNSSAPGASQTLSSSPSSKIASTTGTFHTVRITAHFPRLMSCLAKSPPPPATSHPRLVTKLTKLPSSSAGTSPGWTRPSSTVPSLAPSPVSGGVSVAPPPAPAPVSHGPPQLPHIGKVIQPQPRGAIQTPSASKSEYANGSSKPAWRNVRQGGSTTGIGPPPGVQSEFPTAAEVALGAFVRFSAVLYEPLTFAGHLNGVQDKKQSNDVPATPSSATTEADTFRGVHLNPNAHHWDEVRSLS
jgi:serine/arginine repetitive matrix protein 2